MAEPSHGWVYRNAQVPRERLLALVADLPRGWTWTSANLTVLRNDEGWLGDHGQAFSRTREIRWRKEGDHFDVLVLALESLELDGFQPLRPLDAAEATWQVRGGRYLLRRQGEEGHEAVWATTFLAPDGSAQWVALIGTRGSGTTEKPVPD